jgi:hypothetical protein
VIDACYGLASDCTARIVGAGPSLLNPSNVLSSSKAAGRRASGASGQSFATLTFPLEVTLKAPAGCTDMQMAKA